MWSKLRHQRIAIQKFLDSFLIMGAVLLVLGILLYSLATIPGVSWLHDAGTALLVAGISLIVSTASGKEAVRQQHAKDANIERKNALYAPVYGELKQLWELFEHASKGEAPYPHWIEIKGTGEMPGYTQLLPYTLHSPFPRFTCWPDFQSDHRAYDFSPKAQTLLNDVQDRLAAYNAALAATEQPNTDAVGPHLAAAVDIIIKSPGYQEWHQQVQAATRVRVDIDSWYERVSRIQGTASPVSVHAEAALWLNNFGARGWLLASKLDKAALGVLEKYHHISVPTPPPQAWFQDILRLAWPEIDGLAVNQQARLAATALLQKVREAKDHFEAGLLHIRDHYEGGSPPI